MLALAAALVLVIALPWYAAICIRLPAFTRHFLWEHNVVRFLARKVKIGRTSITMSIRVEAERDGEVLHVTEAEVVYVGIDPSTPERRPVPLLPAEG